MTCREATAVGELVIDEVERPARVRPFFHRDRHPDATGFAAGAALAHRKPFLPIEPVDAVDPRPLALPPQQDEQATIAEPSALIGKAAQPCPFETSRPPNLAFQL